MATTLPLVRQRVDELNKLADEVWAIAERMSKGEAVQPELSTKGQQWYRGARELMVQNDYSGLGEFDDCYHNYPFRGRPEGQHQRSRGDLDAYFSANSGENFPAFSGHFRKAMSLVGALEGELSSRNLQVTSQLSFAVSALEFDTAANILAESRNEEVLIRASGVVGRVAIERHLLTVADGRKVVVTKNPPTKRHADVEDVMQALQRSGVITAIQKSQLDSLFKVANNCAHPKELVNHGDVERLIEKVSS